MFFTLLYSVRRPVRNFHFSCVSCRIYSLFISVYISIILDFLCAYSMCWDLWLINVYLDPLKVLASNSRFFSFFSLIVSVFLHFYCNIFYNFSINYLYLSFLLLWALLNFYWLDFLDVSDCERPCYLRSQISLSLLLNFFTYFSMYCCYLSFDVWYTNVCAWWIDRSIFPFTKFSFSWLISFLLFSACNNFWMVVFWKPTF